MCARMLVTKEARKQADKEVSNQIAILYTTNNHASKLQEYFETRMQES